MEPKNEGEGCTLCVGCLTSGNQTDEVIFQVYEDGVSRGVVTAGSRPSDVLGILSIIVKKYPKITVVFDLGDVPDALQKGFESKVENIFSTGEEQIERLKRL